MSFGLGNCGGRVTPGTPDFVGWETVVVTPAMVGKPLAVFVAIEVKHLSKPTKAQLNFIEQVRAAGGLAGVAHDAAEAAEILAGDWGGDPLS
jgi:hypothetical protein